MKTIRKRRKQCKTDYKRRLNLLKSEKPRVVFRRTNKYVIAQYVESSEARDKIIFGLTSKDLLKYGFPEKMAGSLKSLGACYLTGYLIGKKIVKEKLVQPILDIGMTRALHKNRVYAFLKGLIDSGIKIGCKEEAFPDEERIKEKIPVDEIKNRINKR